MKYLPILCRCRTRESSRVEMACAASPVAKSPVAERVSYLILSPSSSNWASLCKKCRNQGKNPEEKKGKKAGRDKARGKMEAQVTREKRRMANMEMRNNWRALQSSRP